jgi:hypothetical protein
VLNNSRSTHQFVCSGSHASSIAKLREELERLRLQGGISEQFVDWHRRLAGCAEAITREVPSCAALCSEVMSIEFEMPPEFAAKFAQQLTDDPRIMAATLEGLFRSKCAQADEILNTLVITLRQTNR